VTREWVVAAGLIESADGFVLVQNRRRDGSLDWSPPGGVIEVEDGESITDGLTREVREETGLLVSEWEGPVYDVEVVAEGLGWTLRAEAFVARSWSGELAAHDPDGIVVDARWVAPDEWAGRLAGAHPWVREPVEAWLLGSPLSFRYRVDGAPGSSSVVRLH
jgi:8-oxo-dGTP diphosphatase